MLSFGKGLITASPPPPPSNFFFSKFINSYSDPLNPFPSSSSNAASTINSLRIRCRWLEFPAPTNFLEGLMLTVATQFNSYLINVPCFNDRDVGKQSVAWEEYCAEYWLTHSLILHFETVPNSKKLQTTTEMWLLKDFMIQTA